LDCPCPGRFWGVVNPKNIPLGKRLVVSCTGKQASKLRRFMRRFVRSVMGKKWRFNYWSMNCRGDADFWVTRIPRLIKEEYRQNDPVPCPTDKFERFVPSGKCADQHKGKEGHAQAADESRNPNAPTGRKHIWKHCRKYDQGDHAGNNSSRQPMHKRSTIRASATWPIDPGLYGLHKDNLNQSCPSGFGRLPHWNQGSFKNQPFRPPGSHW
jgi:hypothetical protein